MSLKTGVWVNHYPLVTGRHEKDPETVAQIRAILNGTQDVQFDPLGDDTAPRVHYFPESYFPKQARTRT
jgi:hypothetical protein